MFYSNLTKFILALLMCFSLAVRAADTGGEAEPAKKLPSEKDYRKQLSKLNFAKDQIKVLKNTIQDLIKRKNAEKKEAEKRKLVQQIVAQHEELKVQTKIYNEQYRIIKYNFPDKGDHSKRQYLPMRVDTLEELEQGIGLESDLTSARKKVESKYAPLLPKEDYVEKKAKIEQQESEKNSERERIVLEQ